MEVKYDPTPLPKDITIGSNVVPDAVHMVIPGKFGSYSNLVRRARTGFELDSSSIENMHFHRKPGSCLSTPTIRQSHIDNGDWADDIASGNFHLYFCYEERLTGRNERNASNPALGSEEVPIEIDDDEPTLENMNEAIAGSIPGEPVNSTSIASISNSGPMAQDLNTAQPSYLFPQIVDPLKQSVSSKSPKRLESSKGASENASAVSEFSVLPPTNWTTSRTSYEHQPTAIRSPETVSNGQPPVRTADFPQTSLKAIPHGLPLVYTADFPQTSLEARPHGLPFVCAANPPHTSPNTIKDGAISKRIGSRKLTSEGDHHSSPTPGPSGIQEVLASNTAVGNTKAGADEARLRSQIQGFAKMLREHGQRQPGSRYFLVGESTRFLSTDGCRHGAVVAWCWADCRQRIALSFTDFDKHGLPLDTDRPADLPVLLNKHGFSGYQHEIKWDNAYFHNHIPTEQFGERWSWLTSRIVNQYERERGQIDEKRREQFLRSSSRIRRHRRQTDEKRREQFLRSSSRIRRQTRQIHVSEDSMSSSWTTTSPSSSDVTQHSRKPSENCITLGALSAGEEYGEVKRPWDLGEKELEQVFGKGATKSPGLLDGLDEFSKICDFEYAKRLIFQAMTERVALERDGEHAEHKIQPLQFIDVRRATEIFARVNVCDGMMIIKIPKLKGRAVEDLSEVREDRSEKPIDTIHEERR